jgi:hypothetical protein
VKRNGISKKTESLEIFSFSNYLVRRAVLVLIQSRISLTCSRVMEQITETRISERYGDTIIVVSIIQSETVDSRIRLPYARVVRMAISEEIDI